MGTALPRMGAEMNFAQMLLATVEPQKPKEEELLTRADWVMYLVFCVVVIAVLVRTGVLS